MNNTPNSGCSGPLPSLSFSCFRFRVSVSAALTTHQCHIEGVYTWPAAISLSCYIYTRWAFFKQTLPRQVTDSSVIDGGKDGVDDDCFNTYLFL